MQIFGSLKVKIMAGDKNVFFSEVHYWKTVRSQQITPRTKVEDKNKVKVKVK
jgi:hypothetical protein